MIFAAIHNKLYRLRETATNAGLCYLEAKDERFQHTILRRITDHTFVRQGNLSPFYDISTLDCKR